MTLIALVIILIILGLVVVAGLSVYKKMGNKSTPTSVPTTSMTPMKSGGNEMDQIKDWSQAFKMLGNDLNEAKSNIKAGNINVRSLGKSLEAFKNVDDSSSLFSANTQTKMYVDKLSKKIKDHPRIGLRYGDMTSRDLATFRQELLDLRKMIKRDQDRFLNNIAAGYGEDVKLQADRFINDLGKEEYDCNSCVNDDSDMLMDSDLMAGCNEVHSELLADDSSIIPAFARHTESRTRFDGFGNAIGPNVDNPEAGCFSKTIDADYFAALDTNDCS